MNSATKSPASLSIGSTVVRVPVDGPADPRIFEVVDCRVRNGIYSFTIAPVGDRWNTIEGFLASDLREVGR